MVVYAATIVGDLMEAVLGEISEHETIGKMIGKIMSAKGGEMIVTPKDIDIMVEDAAKAVAKAINLAFHPHELWEENKKTDVL